MNKRHPSSCLMGEGWAEHWSLKVWFDNSSFWVKDLWALKQETLERDWERASSISRQTTNVTFWLVCFPQHFILVKGQNLDSLYELSTPIHQGQYNIPYNRLTSSTSFRCYFASLTPLVSGVTSQTNLSTLRVFPCWADAGFFSAAGLPFRL